MVPSAHSQQLIKKLSHILPTPANHHCAAIFKILLTRRLIEFILMSGLIFGANLFVIQNQFFSAVWPSFGVALGACFLRGNVMLIGCFFGWVISYLFNHIPLLATLVHATGFVVCIFIIRALTLRWVGALIPIVSLKSVINFLLLSATFVFIWTVLFYLSLSFYGIQSTALQWYLAWIGGFNGIVCLVPLCLTLDPFFQQYFIFRHSWRWYACGVLIIIAYALSLNYLNQPPAAYYCAIALMIALNFYARIFLLVPLCFTLLGLSVVLLGSNIFLTDRRSSIILTLFMVSSLTSMSVAIIKKQQHYKSM